MPHGLDFWYSECPTGWVATITLYWLKHSMILARMGLVSQLSQGNLSAY